MLTRSDGFFNKLKSLTKAILACAPVKNRPSDLEKSLETIGTCPPRTVSFAENHPVVGAPSPGLRFI